MADTERLLKEAMAELEKLLNAKNVLGDPIDRDGVTVFPIVSYGFGFGAAGGAGEKGEMGGGTGAGGGIKPLGAIIIDGQGARVEGVHGATSELITTVAGATSKAIDKVADIAKARSKKDEG